jgi:hypothetical protein
MQCAEAASSSLADEFRIPKEMDFSAFGMDYVIPERANQLSNELTSGAIREAREGRWLRRSIQGLKTLLPPARIAP